MFIESLLWVSKSLENMLLIFLAGSLVLVSEIVVLAGVYVLLYGILQRAFRLKGEALSEYRALFHWKNLLKNIS